MEQTKDEKHFKQAQQWFEDCPSKSFFGDAKTIAIRAVAEYLANQAGKTLFPVNKNKDEE